MNISNKDIEVLIQWNMNCVEALRGSGHEAGAQAHTETAAMLDALRAENARLREALVYIGEVCIRHDQGNETGRVLGYIADNAREALEAGP
jgi:hypothetical protein